VAQAPLQGGAEVERGPAEVRREPDPAARADQARRGDGQAEHPALLGRHLRDHAAGQGRHRGLGASRRAVQPPQL